MGAQGSTTHQSSMSSTTESSLLKEQAKILRSRQQDYENWYLPEIKKTLEEFDPRSASGKAQMNLNAQEINNSFNSAQKQTNQMLAQQNLLGSGAGTALTAANNRAKASALADAYTSQMASASERRGNLLSNMATLMPSTTNAAPTLSSSSSSGTTRSWGVG